jgi:hypothetical protein
MCHWAWSDDKEESLGDFVGAWIITKSERLTVKRAIMNRPFALTLYVQLFKNEIF